jgi:hypothetical protein
MFCATCFSVCVFWGGGLFIERTSPLAGAHRKTSAFGLVHVGIFPILLEFQRKKVNLKF